MRTLVTTLTSDAHTWNLVYLQLLLEERGHEVVNLGPCVPDELILTECHRFVPDLVVFSTVNGHGRQDAERVVRRLRADRRLDGTRIVIGGKLGIDGGRADRGSLRAAGYDEVFEDGALAEFDVLLSRAERESGHFARAWSVPGGTPAR